jgi:hypothetical protein
VNLLRSEEKSLKMKPNQKINPDLVEERQKVAFDVQEFSNWYYGGAKNVENLDFMGKRKPQNQISNRN